MTDANKPFPDWENLLVTYKQTLEGEWRATVERPGYEDLVGKGLTQASALRQLRNLVRPRLVEETKDMKGGW